MIKPSSLFFSFMFSIISVANAGITSENYTNNKGCKVEVLKNENKSTYFVSQRSNGRTKRVVFEMSKGMVFGSIRNYCAGRSTIVSSRSSKASVSCEANIRSFQKVKASAIVNFTGETPNAISVEMLSRGILMFSGDFKVKNIDCANLTAVSTSPNDKNVYQEVINKIANFTETTFSTYSSHNFCGRNAELLKDVYAFSGYGKSYVTDAYRVREAINSQRGSQKLKLQVYDVLSSCQATELEVEL
jgi:hypothetical protein